MTEMPMILRWRVNDDKRWRNDHIEDEQDVEHTTTMTTFYWLNLRYDEAVHDDIWRYEDDVDEAKMTSRINTASMMNAK